MHYKNGKEAQDGDPVICQGYTGQLTVGKIHTLVPGSTACNCTVAEPVMGGVTQLTCRTVGEMYHAADAFAAIEIQMTNPAQEVAPMPSGGWPRTEPPQAEPPKAQCQTPT